MGLARIFLYTGGLYTFFLLAFPDWSGARYHVVALAMILIGGMGVFFFLQMLKVKSLLVLTSYEAGFAAAIGIFFLWTWPTRPSPLQQIGQGYRPSRTEARQGVKRLGLDPDSGLAKLVTGAFPKP